MKFSRLLVIVAALMMTLSFAQARGSYDRGYRHGCNAAKGYWKKDRYKYIKNAVNVQGGLAGRKN